MNSLHNQKIGVIFFFFSHRGQYSIRFFFHASQRYLHKLLFKNKSNVRSEGLIFRSKPFTETLQSFNRSSESASHSEADILFLNSDQQKIIEAAIQIHLNGIVKT